MFSSIVIEEASLVYRLTPVDEVRILSSIRSTPSISVLARAESRGASKEM